MSTIIERSQLKAERGEAWTPEDHEALVEHLKKIDRLAQDVYDVAVNTENRERVKVSA
jgi:hypothetical protein